MGLIVSASRRCDIPARYMDWFMGRVQAGFCVARNPFNAKASRRVELGLPALDCIVFWTRDPASLAGRAAELAARGLPFIAQATITGYPRALEPAVPETEAALAGIARLAEAIGSERILWRYDPLFVARGLDADWHRRRFDYLATALQGRTERVTLSLLDEYAGTRVRLERAGFPEPIFGSPRGVEDPRGAARGRALEPPEPPEPYPALLRDLAVIATSRGMEALACAEPYDLSAYGIGKAACIDAKLIAQVIGRELEPAKDRHQRGDCLCAPSVDIGAYGSCPARCAYCYANRGEGRLLERGAEDESL